MLAAGKPQVAAVAQLVARYPSDRNAMLELLQRSAGNAFVQQVVVAAASAGPASLETETTEVERATQLDALVRTALLPAYRRAVDALDPGAAVELATHILSAVGASQRGEADAAAALKRGASAALVSTPDAPIDDTPDAASGRLAGLTTAHDALGKDLAALVSDLAVELGPQKFRDQLVMGARVTPALGRDPAAYLAGEATATITLLGVVREVQAISGATGAASPRLDDAQRAQIAALVEPWHSRPVNYAFLARALGALGVWDAIAGTKGPSGRTLEGSLARSRQQAKETGALADVGELDMDDAARELHTVGLAGIEFGPSDDTASAILDRIASAAPDARGPIIRQLDARRRLEPLCKHLPWSQVKSLYDAVQPFDATAAGLLKPYFAGKGGGESMHQRYMDQVDEHVAKDQKVRAFGWFFLDFLHNAMTAGFEREYSDAYDAHEQGLITDDDMRSRATKALGKAALITAVSAATGGIAGEFVQSFAAPAGDFASGLLGGVAGGATAGISGHFTGDVYDQMVNGKQGFDSLGDYGRSARDGLVAGGLGSLLSGLSLGAARFLGADVKSSFRRAGDIYAAKYPRMTRFLEAARTAGAHSRVVVSAKVSEALDLIHSLSPPGGPPPQLAFAMAGGGDLRSLPPTADVRIALRPTMPLDKPMQSSRLDNDDGGGKQPDLAATGGADKPPLVIDEIEPAEPVSKAAEPVTEAEPSRTESSSTTSTPIATASATIKEPTTSVKSKASTPLAPLEPGFKLGKMIGGGGEKDVYAIDGRDDVVIGVVRERGPAAAERLNKEVQKLKELADLGVPTVEVIQLTEYEGRPAVVMKRYAEGSKTAVKTIKSRVRIVGEIEYLNERSIQDLERIRQTLEQTPIRIHDLQFLIGEDGSVVVADAIDVLQGEKPSDVNRATINKLIEAARAEIARKEVK